MVKRRGDGEKNMNWRHKSPDEHLPAGNQVGIFLVFIAFIPLTVDGGYVFKTSSSF
jgi:hypothetical protein